MRLVKYAYMYTNVTKQKSHYNETFDDLYLIAFQTNFFRKLLVIILVHIYIGVFFSLNPVLFLRISLDLISRNYY
jgi:hypothetical protein